MSILADRRITAEPKLFALIRHGNDSAVRELLLATPAAASPLACSVVEAPIVNGECAIKRSVPHGMAPGTPPSYSALDLANSSDTNGCTALMEAAALGFDRIVAILLKAGANCGAINSFGSTALHRAATSGNPTVVSQLLTAMQDTPIVASPHPLIMGVEQPENSWLEGGEAKGGLIPVVNSFGHTALFDAVKWGHAEVVQLLIATGKFDLNTANARGHTLLMEACVTGHVDVVRVLVEHGACVDAVDINANTALIKAVIGDSLPVVQYLLSIDSGRKTLDLANRSNQTALTFSHELMNPDIRKYLIALGAKGPLPTPPASEPIVVPSMAKLFPGDLLPIRTILTTPFTRILHGTYQLQPVVIKEFTPGTIVSEEAYWREVSLQFSLRHQHVVTVFGGVIEPTEDPKYPLKYIIVMERMSRSLGNAVSPSVSPPPLSSRLRWLLEVSLALWHLHSLNIIHGDIKPDNVLLTSEGPDAVAKVTDFSLAQKRDDTHQTSVGLRGYIGTPAYMDPVLLSGEGFLQKSSDIYSFGVVMCEVLSLERPYSETGITTLKDLREYVCAANGRPRLPFLHTAAISSQLLDTIVACWDGDPERRPPASYIARILQAEVQAMAYN